MEGWYSSGLETLLLNAIAFAVVAISVGRIMFYETSERDFRSVLSRSKMASSTSARPTIFDPPLFRPPIPQEMRLMLDVADGFKARVRMKLPPGLKTDSKKKYPMLVYT